MKTWICTDGNADVEIEAETATKAAQEYVDNGDWHECDETSWVVIYCQEIDINGEEIGYREGVKIAIDPPEPECEADEHDWQSPHDIVGGLKENPGVYGHGGGVTIHEVCSHCGVHRHIDTWATDREDGGSQGHRSVRYSEKIEEEISYV